MELGLQVHASTRNDALRRESLEKSKLEPQVAQIAKHTDRGG